MRIVPRRSHLAFDLVSLALDRSELSFVRCDVPFDLLLLVWIDCLDRPVAFDVSEPCVLWVVFPVKRVHPRVVWIRCRLVKHSRIGTVGGAKHNAICHMSHAAHDLVVDSASNELLGANFVEREHRGTTTPSNVSRRSVPDPHRICRRDRNCVIADTPEILRVQHPRRQLVKHFGELVHYRRRVFGVDRLLVSSDQADRKPFLGQRTSNLNAEVGVGTALSSAFLDRHRYWVLGVHRFGDRVVHRKNHRLLVFPRHERLGFYLRSWLMYPQRKRKKKQDIGFARLQESIAEPFIDQRSLAATDPPLEVLNRVFGYQIVEKR